jgi:hypothetical protein
MQQIHNEPMALHQLFQHKPTVSLQGSSSNSRAGWNMPLNAFNHAFNHADVVALLLPPGPHCLWWVAASWLCGKRTSMLLNKQARLCTAMVQQPIQKAAYESATAAAAAAAAAHRVSEVEGQCF